MKTVSLRANSGLTLVELMVSIGIMTLMFTAIGFLVILTSRNTLLVSEQARSQNHAAAAAERVTNIVRNASRIHTYGSDTTTSRIQRILYDIPDASAASGVKTGAIAFVPPSSPTESDGVVKVFENASDYNPSTLATTKATYEFSGIQNFGIDYRTSTWMTVRFFYSYRGYINFAAHNNDYVNKMAGEFITDVIAKNHHPGEGAHYAETTSSVFLL